MPPCADHRDGDFALRTRDAFGDGGPATHIRLGRGLDAEGGEHLRVEAGGMIGARHIVNIGGVARLDHRLFADVAEQAELATLFARNLAVGAAQQNIGLDADGAQLFHRMLRRFGFEFAGAGDEGQQRQMHIDAMMRRQIVLELANRFEEGQGLDVADRAADFDQNEIDIVIAVEHELLDGVGDMRNHLNGRAEIIAAPFAIDDVLIDAPGGDVVLPCGRTSGEALVMSEIEIRLGAVVGDEDFAVLIGAHRPRIDVEIGIELAKTDRVATRLQKRAEHRRRQAFAKGGNHAAGDENVPRHGTYRLSIFVQIE